jgi:hypothetical protein
MKLLKAEQTIENLITSIGKDTFDPGPSGHKARIKLSRIKKNKEKIIELLCAGERVIELSNLEPENYYKERLTLSL